MLGRTAEDPHFCWIGNTLLDEKVHAVGEVMLHRTDAPLLVTGVEESLAVPGRAAKVRLQNRVAPVGEELDLRIEAPVVAGPGAAVGIDDDGQAYYYWGQFRCRAARLQPNLSAIESSSTRSKM